MSPKELAAVSAAVAIVDWWRQYPDQPRTERELRLWRAIDALEGRFTADTYRVCRQEAERQAAAKQ